ncbi:MAG: TraB/GumN family protein [Deltaproteobacteria bacterium]|nr:TraB/GumN family protein [Deltaproteobacteria bacterium]
MRAAKLSAPALTWLVALLLSLGCSSREIRRPTYEDEGGEAPVAEQTEAPTVARITEEPFVWEVSKDGKTSHIMGTIHVGVTLDEALPPRLQDAAANARVVMLEIDPSDVDPAVMLAAARLPEGERQDQLYTPGVWHEIANQLNTTMNEQTLRTLRPWFTMLMLLQTVVGRMHDGAPPEGMDMTLFRMAGEVGVTMRPLETVQDQVNALASPPDAEVARMVSDMIEGMQAGQNELELLLEAYRSADLARIGMILLDPDEREMAPEFHAALIDRRNEAWMAPLQEELVQGDAFIAVGLGHLVGPEGILARLRNVGYTVDRTR